MKFKKSALAVSILSALMVTACGGGSSGGGSKAPENWATSTGESDTSKIETVTSPDQVTIPEGCDAAVGALIVQDLTTSGFSSYGAWIWDKTNNNANILGASAQWPGEQITESVSACTNKTLVYTHGTTSFENHNVIVNDFEASGNKPQTGDTNVFTAAKSCLKITEVNGENATASFVSATECGVTVGGQKVAIPDEVKVYQGDTVLTPGSTITINEIEGKAGSDSTVLTLTMRGVGLDSTAKGKYWLDDAESSAVEFTNGEKIKIGDKIKVEEGATKEVVLHVQYTVPEEVTTNDTSADGKTVTEKYIIKKTYSVKNAECRLNKQEQTLGATYTATATTFRIWSPDSSDVKVTVDGTEHVLTKSTLDCYSNVYEVTVDGDLAGKEYQFTIGGTKARDPYGKMVAKGSDTANIVMDMTQTEPEGGWADVPKLKNREDSVIYEVHVRDFTIDETSGVDADKKGRYLGMVQTGTTYGGVTTGIDHLKELGVTHVQIQPMYDYATCSKVDSQNGTCYNWGYDPWNYNVPEDRYSSVFGTDNYNQKIKEVKEMINEFHKNGIRVVMDVVYNHTMDKSVFSGITSKYYLSKDLSGCGNTVNADNSMVWTMIRDSMDYWVTEFHVDGFRLDLAGAFAMQDYSDWGVYLNKRHPNANLVIYGEPWAADNDEVVVNKPVRTGRMHTAATEAHVGAFNNRIRNCLKGSSDNGENLGFIFNKLNDGWDGNGSDENDNGLSGNKECVYTGVIGGVRHADATGTDVWSAQGFADPEQNVSYITAHDNLALRDKIEAAGVESESEAAKALQVYANSIIMITQGMTFIHGGEEIGRTKAAAGTDMHNTYNTTTGANDFKWDLKAGAWKGVSNSYADYIKMRKEHPAFRMTTAEKIFANVKLDEASTNEIVIVNIDGAAVNDKWASIKIVMNSTDTAYTVSVDEGMVKVADGTTVGDSVTNDTSAAPKAVSIWATPNPNVSNLDALYFVGAPNGWSHQEMTYADGKWTIDNVTLNSTTEFKFTSEANWSSIIYNMASGETKICAQGTDGCPTDGNIKLSTLETEKTGKITVDDRTLELTFE